MWFSFLLYMLLMKTKQVGMETVSEIYVSHILILSTKKETQTCVNWAKLANQIHYTGCGLEIPKIVYCL